ncbi:unnamed protein product [Ilex paraguariensis]|uniref:RRM domain-containing protein n=1 Tax=Ilex paraguariensis TaxID=185542 RepID=A0ABC8UZF8_9AQUA
MSYSSDPHAMDHQESGVKGSEVFVGGLAPTITEDKIREVFSTCGEILEVRLIKDPKGNLKGFCFVRFATKEAAQKAVKEKSGLMLEGRKIGVLPSTEQSTLYLGNLNKGWSADEFDKIVHQVFPDVVSVNLAMPFTSGDKPLGKKQQNRGFAFVKFSSHAAAARAYRVGSRPDFLLGGNLHPVVQWAEEELETDPKELAKVTIAFVRNLPIDADENYLRKLFEPFGKVDNVVLSRKGQSPIGFVHFTRRSDLDNAIRERHGKTVQGPNGGASFMLEVEIARPMDKKKKRAREDPQSKQYTEIPSHSKLQRNEEAFIPFGGHISKAQKVKYLEPVVADPYEAAVVSLPVAVKERLLRILRLGIATRFDIDIHCLTSLQELPESTAISVLDQFMLSAADKHNKGAYLVGLISRHQVSNLGLSRLPLSFSRLGEITTKESELTNFSSRARLPAGDSLAPHIGATVARSDTLASRYSSVFSDYPLSSRAALGRVKETSPVSLHQIPGSSPPYGKIKVESHASAVDHQPVRPRVRFDPFTGKPYKFDPFTGEPILPPESLPRHFGSPY